MNIVIDSSILIDYFRGGTKWQEFLEDAPKDAELFLPTIVIFELFSGKSTKKSGVAKDILNLLKQFTSIELTIEIAIKAGELYREIGSRIDPADYIIAASAFSIGGKALTLNRKHFEKIPNLSLYPL